MDMLPSIGHSFGAKENYERFGRLLLIETPKPIVLLVARLRGLVRAFCSLTAFYLKYADPFLMNKKGAIDSASGFYFMGRKEEQILADRDLVGYYPRSRCNVIFT